MSKFENEQEKKVRDILLEELSDFDVLKYWTMSGRLSEVDKIMLRIRPFLSNHEFLRDLYSITEDDEVSHEEQLIKIQDAIENYLLERGDDL